MTERWLVTGGAGFIGSHLVDRLLARGDQAVVLDNFSTGSMRNLPCAGGGIGLTVIRGDVSCDQRLAAAMMGVSGVFHCAALVGVQDCIDDWLGAHATNAIATIRVFDAARRAGNLPVVYASSAAVYGDRSGEVCHEGMPERPVSPYGADKLACENQARAFWRIHGLPVAGLRLFNAYGPRQSAVSPYSGVLARFGRNWQTSRPNVVFGDGMQSRDFVHVSDVVSGMTAAMAQLRMTPQCVVSNICTGRSVSILELLEVIANATGVAPGRIEFRPERAGEIRHSHGATECMTGLLGLGPTVPLEEGVHALLSSLQPQQAIDAPLVQAAE